LNGLIGELVFAIQDHLEARNPNGDYESPGTELVKKRPVAGGPRAASASKCYHIRTSSLPAPPAAEAKAVGR